MVSYREELARFFYKGPDSKYARYCKPYGLCQNYSTHHFSAIKHPETVHKLGYPSLSTTDISGQILCYGQLSKLEILTTKNVSRLS